MSRFLDGPAAGADVAMRRAPIYLRVVIDQAGNLDTLDQLDDTPRAGETVHVYRSVPGTFVRAFVRPGGCYEHAEYRHVQVDAAALELRDTVRWRTWAEAQR